MFGWFTAHQFAVQTIAVDALLAFSVQVAVRAGAFSLAGVGFYGVGSYSAAYLVKQGDSAILAIAVGIAISAVVGWVLARLLVRLRDLYLAMATVAFDLLVGVIVNNWTKVTGGATGLYAIPVRVTMLEMVITVAAVAGILSLLEAGTLGRSFLTTREDERLAQSLSIDTNSQRRFAFVLSAMIGSLAGAYHALSSFSVSPGDLSFNVVILILAMVIIGGFRTWIGALCGAILLVWIPLQLSGLGTSWPVVYGIGLLVVAVYLPTGLIGGLQSLWQAWKRSRPGPLVPGDAREVPEPAIHEKVT